VMAVKELPRTPNGKLDYTRLVESGRHREAAAAG